MTVLVILNAFRAVLLKRKNPSSAIMLRYFVKNSPFLVSSGLHAILQQTLSPHPCPLCCHGVFEVLIRECPELTDPCSCVSVCRIRWWWESAVFRPVWVVLEEEFDQNLDVVQVESAKNIESDNKVISLRNTQGVS